MVELGTFRGLRDTGGLWLWQPWNVLPPIGTILVSYGTYLDVGRDVSGDLQDGFIRLDYIEYIELAVGVRST